MPEIQAPSPNGDGNAVKEVLYKHLAKGYIRGIYKK